MDVMLKEIGDIITGNTPSKNSKEFWNSKDICFIKPDIIADSRVHEVCESNEYISECARKKARIVSKDSIFVTCIGSIGKVGIAGEGEYAFNQQINAIVPNEKVNPRYLAYNLIYNKPRLVDIANAPVVPIINKSQFGEFIINIEFDINKQSRIVCVLDKLSSLIEKYNREIITLDKLIRARFVEMFGDPIINEKCWDVVKLNTACNGIGDGLHGTPKYDEDGVYPFINGNNLKDGVIEATSLTKMVNKETYKKYCITMNHNTILLSINGTLGKLALYNGEEVMLGKSVCYCNLKSEINREFVYGVMNTDAFNIFLESNATASTIKNVGLKAIREFKLILPPKELQNKYVDFVDQVNKSKLLAVSQPQIHIYKTLTLL